MTHPRPTRHAAALAVALAALLAHPGAGAYGQSPAGPDAVVAGQTLTVASWPPVSLELAPAFTHIGGSDFQLYDVAAAETHVFVDAGSDGVVDRLYWVQVEQALPDSDHRYDYSRLPRSFVRAGLDFVADVRFGAGYSLESVDREGDTAEVLRLLSDAGYSMPAEMMRIRMVTLDESRRRELLVIYLEDLALHDLSVAVLDAAGDAAWRRIADRLQERALDGMRVRRTDGDRPADGDDELAGEPAGAESPAVAEGEAAASTLERLDVSGFAFQHVLTIAAPPDSVWAAITGDLSGWWDHNFSGDPARFFLEPWPGGRFLEEFDEGSSDGVLHGTVTFAKRPELLRFEGPLGLTGFAVHGVYTYQLEAVPGGTRLTLSTRMVGEIADGWPEVVQRVWHHFLFDRLKPYIEGELP